MTSLAGPAPEPETAKTAAAPAPTSSSAAHAGAAAPPASRPPIPGLARPSHAPPSEEEWKARTDIRATTPEEAAVIADKAERMKKYDFNTLSSLKGEVDPNPNATAAEAAKNAQPEKPKAGGKPFDHADAESSMKQLRERVDKFPRIAQTAFVDTMQQYVNAAGSPDEAVAAGAGNLLEQALKILVDVDAFRIPAHKYAEATQTAEGTENAIAEATESSMLWSKMTHYRAVDEVEDGARGNSLEGSAAGSLFNGLGFGMDYGTHMVLQKQWKEVSQNYVSNVRGVVHAYLFEGVHPDSVFTKTEWPIVAKLMRNHKRDQTIVTELVVHIFALNASGTDLEEVGQQSIWHPDQWLELPSARDLDDVDDETGQAFAPDAAKVDKDGRVINKTTTWKDRQNAAYAAETKRHETSTPESRKAERDKQAAAKAALREKANQVKARFVPADDE